jgi:cellulose synthase/poly-beta-1,6-N-acetylglucosamine synthase-like glycosyltransferase
MLYLFLCCTCFCILSDWLAWLKIRKEKTKTLPKMPFVSILVAARNEEANILACLHSLAKLSYPHVEILIGDDNSTDNTLNIVQNFIKDKPQFAVIQVKEKIGTAIAKANVLAQLAQKAKGEWLFVTDADVQMPANWVENMLSVEATSEIITGFTWVKGKGLFAVLQALDWTFALATAKMFSYFGLPLTAMGNNMAVRRETYLQTGGYENMPPTLVEDFMLFKKIAIEGRKPFYQAFSHRVMAETKAIDNFGRFLQQRKRWMQGALQAHWTAKIYLFLRVGFYPLFLLMLFLAITSWQYVLILFVIKLFWQSVALHNFLKIIGKTKFIWAFGLYEIYLAVLSVILPIYYLIPLKIKWKGRQFTL